MEGTMPDIQSEKLQNDKKGKRLFGTVGRFFIQEAAIY